MSKYPRTGTCIWCREYIEDAREHSGWTRPETDWAAPFDLDGETHYDWGCERSPLNDEEGTGGHVDMSDLWRNWHLYDAAPEREAEHLRDIIHCNQRVVNLLEALRVVTAGAQLLPDPRMNGATDVWAVPLDDIEDAVAAIAQEEKEEIENG